MITGKIHSVETFGAVDGPGIRYVVFFQGCPLKCIYCHNPDTWNISDGYNKTTKEIMDDIISYRNFLSGGVTLSGGEPLYQPEFAYELLCECKKNGFHTAVDTAGSVPLTISKKVIDAADMLLLDIKAENFEIYEKITNNKNACLNAFNTLQYCEDTKKSVWIRHVIIPNYTLEYEMLKKLSEKLQKFNCIKRVDILPFHKMGEYKWAQLKKTYLLNDTLSPPQTEIAKIKQLFNWDNSQKNTQNNS